MWLVGTYFCLAFESFLISSQCFKAIVCWAEYFSGPSSVFSGLPNMNSLIPSGLVVLFAGE